MSKYLIQFEKDGLLRFISHLDLMRLFQRTFKRADMPLIHSQGFNPHPKMSFAHPLSLGFTSQAEYLEVETEQELLPAQIRDRLNALLPEGVRIAECRRAEGKKSAAALVEFGAYEIAWELPEGRTMEREEPEEFLKLEEWLVGKTMKKKRGTKEINIRPMIVDFRFLGQERGTARLYTVLNTGSASNLNPLLMLEGFAGYCGIPFDEGKIRIKRTELYCQERGKMRPLLDLGRK